MFHNFDFVLIFLLEAQTETHLGHRRETAELTHSAESRDTLEHVERNSVSVRRVLLFLHLLAAGLEVLEVVREARERTLQRPDVAIKIFHGARRLGEPLRELGHGRRALHPLEMLRLGLPPPAALYFWQRIRSKNKQYLSPNQSAFHFPMHISDQTQINQSICEYQKQNQRLQGKISEWWSEWSATRQVRSYPFFC